MTALSQTCVIFQVGEELFALPIGTVESIVRYEKPTPVPHSSADVLGVVNLRGRIVPIVDLRHRFHGVTFSEGPYSRIIVAESVEGPVGLAVDVAREVANVATEDILPVPESVVAATHSRAFSGVVEREGHLVVLLELDEAVPTAVWASSETEVAAGATEGGTDDA
jgi:purine-binding chemotaxis protein CheW